MNPYEPLIVSDSSPGPNILVRLWNILICIALIGLAWLAATIVPSRYSEFMANGDLTLGYWGWFLGGVANDVFTLAVLALFLLGCTTTPLHYHRRVTQITTLVICAMFSFNFQISHFRVYAVQQSAITTIALFPMLVFGCGILHGYATAFRWFQANFRH